MVASDVDRLPSIEVAAFLKPCHTILKHRIPLSFNRDFQTRFRSALLSGRGQSISICCALVRVGAAIGAYFRE